MKYYRILPHDARIIATALEYGAKKVATFDTDFKRAREIVDLSPDTFWKSKP
ncbi:PIN domain-containing protein [Thermococcus sp.]